MTEDKPVPLGINDYAPKPEPDPAPEQEDIEQITAPTRTEFDRALAEKKLVEYVASKRIYVVQENGGTRKYLRTVDGIRRVDHLLAQEYRQRTGEEFANDKP